MRITYSSWKSFKECPKKFYLQYVLKEPSEIPIDDYYKIYGNIVGKFFELFCNQWRFNDRMSPDMINDKLKILYGDILKYSIVNWNSRFAKYSKEEIYEQAWKSVCAVMESETINYFLNAKAEVSINVTLANNHVITGRLDFIHKNPVIDGVVVIDGKGTDKVGKYVDKDQLLFYCLLYKFKHHLMPRETGFFYYRFNSYVKMPLSLDILNEFRARLSLDIKAMEKDNFAANPGYKACKFCPYHVTCKEYLEKKSKGARPSAIDIETNNEEIAQFSF